MKKIPLTQGKHAIVDDADYDFLMQWKWHTRIGTTKLYAGRTKWYKKEKHHRAILMHRLLFDDCEGKSVDHINHDGLDNRRSNLRLCTHSENLRNSKKRKGCVSKYKGVCIHKQTGNWTTQIRGKHVGVYDTEIEAAKAYDEQAKILYGEFANLNF